MDGNAIKKGIFVIGIILLVIIWTRNLGLFSFSPKPYKEAGIEQDAKEKATEGRESKEDKGKVSFSINQMKLTSDFVYQEDYKDPFEAPFFYEKEKRDSLALKALKAKKDQLPPPKLVLVGIAWDPERPVATIKNELGQTLVVMQKDKIGDVLVDKITREEVYYTFKGRRYKLLISGR
ncbi:MAG TPA: hypothetical protein VGB16_04595 [candidate division Zixibacteria bacterium]